MAEADSGVKITVENPNAAAEASAEAALQAARDTEAAARLLEAQVTQNAAVEIAEHQETVNTLESDVSWLKTKAMELEASILAMATATSGSLAALETKVEALMTQLTPPPPPPEVEAEILVTESAEGQKDQKTASAKQSKRVLI